MSQGEIQKLHDIYTRCSNVVNYLSDEDPADIVNDMYEVLKSVFD